MSHEGHGEIDPTFAKYVEAYIFSEDDEHDTHVAALFKDFFAPHMNAEELGDLADRLVAGAAVELEHTLFMVGGEGMSEKARDKWTAALDPIVGMLAYLRSDLDAIPRAELDRTFVSTILSIALSHLTETLYYYDYLEEVEERGLAREDAAQQRWFATLRKSFVPASGLARQKRLNAFLEGGGAASVSRLIGEQLRETPSLSAAISAVRKAAAPAFPALP